ncbi:MAG: M48 family metalloprotease [Caulobacterales bacterium]|nr:M48 family metalloprotease [Caulobacterales bacterium]
MRGAPHRLVGVLTAMALIAAPAQAQLRNPFGGTAVDGRKGPFIQQIKTRTFSAPAAATGALGFGALEQGDIQRARLRSPAIEAQVLTLLKTLDARWPYARNGALKVYLVATDDYIAAAKPDGSMTVSIGLLDKAESDDEVAFLLAHELMHIRLNHFAREQSMATMRQLATRTARTYRQAVEISQLRARNIGNGVGVANEDDRRVRKAAAQAGAARRRMDLMLSLLVESPWARANEDEADAGGYDVAQLAGYSSEAGAAAAFRHMEADYDARRASAALVQSQLTDSLKILSDDMQKSQGLGGAASALRNQSRTIRTNLSNGLLGVGVKFFQQQHRSPETRVRGISGYSRAAYPDAGLSPETRTKWLKGVQASKAFIDARTAVKAMAQAQAAAGEGEFDRAVRLMGPALRTVYANQPFVANESARIYAAAGAYAQAERAFTIAHKSPDQTLDGYQDHVQMLIDTGSLARAGAVIKEATARYKDERPFLPALITISLRTGQKEATSSYMQKCMATESAELKTACVFAMYDARSQKQYEALPPNTRAMADAELNKRSTESSAGDTPLLGNVNNFLRGLQGGNSDSGRDKAGGGG